MCFFNELKFKSETLGPVHPLIQSSLAYQSDKNTESIVQETAPTVWEIGQLEFEAMPTVPRAIMILNILFFIVRYKTLTLLCFVPGCLAYSWTDCILFNLDFERFFLLFLIKSVYINLKFLKFQWCWVIGKKQWNITKLCAVELEWLWLESSLILGGVWNLIKSLF